MLLWLWIVVRIVANPISNVFQKTLTHQGLHPLFLIGATHGLLSLVCLPVVWREPLPSGEGFWVNMAICTLLNISGNTMLVQALKLADLSVLGPINAYKSVVSLLPGMLLLGEFPGTWGLLGIALIVGGSYSLFDRKRTDPATSRLSQLLGNRGIQLRFAALVLTAVEAVFFKKALLVSSALTAFAWWSVLGLAASLLVTACHLHREQITHNWRLAKRSFPTILLLMVTTGAMQLSTTLVLAEFPVSYALALFQTSAILSVALGYHVFREPHFVQRLLGSMIMVVGAGLVILTR